MKLHRYIDHDWKMTPVDFEVTRYIDHEWQVTPIDFQVISYINHDWQMTPIDFQVTWSKIKVTVTRNSEMVSG
ncbi:hypothetical protein DPMN_132312 [Dreissena polymorpha]|uniref:Uncharacterized protein n=1 Tax=Dreissena polymorpha TaxID=45954 RepID=A0A9D4J8R9_DREPO|nr:hypothetical protein DPMN_132312 [Dreissena polymorpha]